MEGFIESFIYLLITIVILVLSMRKKKQVNLPESEEEDRPGDPFSDLFRDEPEEEEESEYRPATASGRSGEITEEYTTWMTDEPAHEQTEVERSNPWMTETEAEKLVIDADAVLREASENNPIAEMEGQIDDAYHIGTSDDSQIKFDLKKAVIYSEILERRVF